MSPPSARRPKIAGKPATKSIAKRAADVRENNPARYARGGRDKSSSTSSSKSSSRVKVSEAIPLKQAADVLAALIHSDHLDLVPNRMMTINLQAAGVTDSVATIGRLMKLMRDAMRKHGGDLAYIWVRESGHVVGDHVHILFHLPPGSGNWLAKRKPGWLKRCGIGRGKRVSRTSVIRGSHVRQDVGVACPDLYSINVQRVVEYVLKHCSPDVQCTLGITRRGPCLIVGKRVSISQNLHRSARSKCAQCTATA